MRELDKKTKLMTRIASIIATGCILLSSIQSLAYQPSIMQRVTDTFDGISIVQPSSLYENPNQVHNEVWMTYPEDDCGQAVTVNGREVYITGYANTSAGNKYDTYLVKYDAEMRYIWSVNWGGTGNQKAYGVATWGNYVYITGSATNASTGYLNMFVNKYGTNGTLIWNRNYSAGTPNVNKEGYAIVSTADAVYIAGYDGINQTVWKYYHSGVRDWYNTTAINKTSCATGIATDGGWVYIVGYSTTPTPNCTNLFVRSLNFNASSGNLYVKPVGSPTADERGYGIALKGAYIYITGRAGNYGNKNTYQALVMKLNTGLAVQWTRYWDMPGGSNRWDSGLSIALMQDYVLFSGYSKDTSSPAYVGQAIIAGYYTNGTSAFNKTYGILDEEDTFRGIAAGRNCVYVVGGTSYESSYTKFNSRFRKYSTITHCPATYYTHGSNGHNLNWTLYTGAGSPTEHNYTIYLNGTMNYTAQWAPTPWQTGFPIGYNIDNLPVGDYNFTIIAGLIDGDVVQDTTYVTVANALPVINMPTTAAMEFTTLGNNLSSTITDLSTRSTKFWLLQNGSLNQTGSWEHNVPIEWEVDGLAEGSYNFTIVVNDGYGSNVSGTTILTVSNWAPVITMPATVAVNGDIGGNVLSGTIADRSIGAIQTYVVYRNGIPVQSGFWVHNLPILWNVDGLAAESYNFTIVATDGLGLTGRGTTIATVSAAQTYYTPGLGEAALTLAIISLGLIGTHLGWHVYRKYVPGRKSKDRP